MSRVRLAVIGAGHLGRIHARLARALAEIELVAVVDPVAANHIRESDRGLEAIGTEWARHQAR